MADAASFHDNLSCQNEACPMRGRKKYPSGKGVNPPEELVSVELLISSWPARYERMISGTAWLCYTPCLDRLFATQHVRRRLADFRPEESVVRWSYYADCRYVSVQDFAQAFPDLFSDILRPHVPPPQISFALFAFFARWRT